jgi:hypothetical protein
MPFPARGSIVSLMGAALQAELSMFGADLTTQDCEAVMAAVLECSGTAAKTSNEQAHESQRPDR